MNSNIVIHDLLFRYPIAFRKAKLYTILAFLSAIELSGRDCKFDSQHYLTVSAQAVKLYVVYLMW